MICHLAEPPAGADLLYNIPDDTRAHIISIDGFLTITALGSGTALTAHLVRSGRDRSWVATSSTLDINSTTQFHFSLFHKVDFKDKTRHIQVTSLPEHMWAEPGDEIHLERIAGTGTDQFSQVSITYRAFRLEPAPNRLRGIWNAFTR